MYICAQFRGFCSYQSLHLQGLTIKKKLMNISKENIDSLHINLKIELQASDYKLRVESVLADYRKTLDMPGFRKGKVPMAIVKKRYEVSAKVEEINKLLSDAISKYILDEKLDILGNPLPKQVGEIDWQKQEDFIFEYELGLSPVFDLKMSKKNKITLYSIKADESMIDDYAADIAKRYGKMSSPDIVEEKDLVYGTFHELDINGNHLEGGITNQASVSLDFVKDKKLKKEIIGSSKGAVFQIDIKKAFDNDTDAAAMLNLEKQVYLDLTSKFTFTIDNISRMEPAKIDSTLFDKVYGEGVVKDEKEFREKIAAEAEKMFEVDADRKFQNDSVDFLLENNSFELPEDFLKRWMQSVSDKPVTMEEIEKDFDSYKKSLKWQMIENKIAKDHQLSVSKEEALSETKKIISAQMAQYGQAMLEDIQLDKYAQNVLSNKEEEKKIYDRVFSSKITSFFKESFKIIEKEISYKDFIKLGQT